MSYKYFFILSLLFLAADLFAKDLPKQPSPPRIVNDFAGMMSASEMDALERKLVAYNDTSSTQIAVVTERSLEGEDIFDYTVRLAKAWGIGQKDKNNGILLYVALDDRKIYIQVGYGAEGFLPDAIAKRIIENIIKPAFRDGQYYQGIDRATSAIMQYGSGEYTAEESEGDVATAIIVFAIIVIVFLFIIIAIAKASKNSGGDDGGYWRGGRYDEPRSRGGGGWIFFPPTGGGGWSNNSGGNDWGGFGGFGGGDGDSGGVPRPALPGGPLGSGGGEFPGGFDQQ